MMKLNKLLFTMKPQERYRIILVDENNQILEDCWYSTRLPAPTHHYKVLNIRAVHEENALPDFATYIQITVREIFK